MKNPTYASDKNKILLRIFCFSCAFAFLFLSFLSLSPVVIYRMGIYREIALDCYCTVTFYADELHTECVCVGGTYIFPFPVYRHTGKSSVLMRKNAPFQFVRFMLVPSCVRYRLCQILSSSVSAPSLTFLPVLPM